jgi:hypothetical protein
VLALEIAAPDMPKSSAEGKDLLERFIAEA